MTLQIGKPWAFMHLIQTPNLPGTDSSTKLKNVSLVIPAEPFQNLHP
jgi:hypothetical protein